MTVGPLENKELMGVREERSGFMGGEAGAAAMTRRKWGSEKGESEGKRL